MIEMVPRIQKNLSYIYTTFKKQFEASTNYDCEAKAMLDSERVEGHHTPIIFNNMVEFTDEYIDARLKAGASLALKDIRDIFGAFKDLDFHFDYNKIHFKSMLSVDELTALIDESKGADTGAFQEGDAADENMGDTQGESADVNADDPHPIFDAFHTHL